MVFKMLLAAIVFSVATAQSNASNAAERVEYKRMPWHLVDLWWDVAPTEQFASFSMDVEIVGNPAEETRLYISPVGGAKINGRVFYGGIQTAVDGNSRADKRMRLLGRGFLYSMWDERELDAIRPSEGGFLQSSGHEGDFVSVRRPYNWQPGKYTVSYVRMEPEQIDERTDTWVGSFVRRHETNENIFVGALRFAGDDLKLAPRFPSFVEIYGRAVPVEQIPKMTITFSNPRINGKPSPPRHISAIYPDGVPDYAQASLSKEGGEQGSVTIELGQPVERKERREILLGK